MEVVEMVAIRQLTGTDWKGRKYRAAPGGSFKVSETHATRLMVRGLARRAQPVQHRPVMVGPSAVVEKTATLPPVGQTDGELLSKEAFQRNQERIKEMDTFRRDLRVAMLLNPPGTDAPFDETNTDKPETDVEERKTVRSYATKTVRPKTKRTKGRRKKTK